MKKKIFEKIYEINNQNLCVKLIIKLKGKWQIGEIFCKIYTEKLISLIYWNVILQISEKKIKCISRKKAKEQTAGKSMQVPNKQTKSSSSSPTIKERHIKTRKYLFCVIKLVQILQNINTQQRTGEGEMALS